MAHDLEKALTGISGILVTPYDDAGEIAPHKLAPIIDRAIGAGVHILVVNGNTGEFCALTRQEACTMVREVAKMIAGRAPLLAGVGRGLRNACELARASADAGDYPMANRLIEDVRIFEDIRAEEQNSTNVTGVKAAFMAIGQDCGPTRPPSAWPLTDRQQRALDTFITDNRLTELKEAA
jgi:dihydrodipicolinate synthase/N-acetylneuraminate lyase